MEHRKVVPVNDRTFAIQSTEQEVVVRSRVVISKQDAAMRTGVFINGTEVSNIGFEIDMQSGTLVGYVKPPSGTYLQDKPQVLFTYQLWEGP